MVMTNTTDLKRGEILEAVARMTLCMSGVKPTAVAYSDTSLTLVFLASMGDKCVVCVVATGLKLRRFPTIACHETLLIEQKHLGLMKPC